MVTTKLFADVSDEKDDLSIVYSKGIDSNFLDLPNDLMANNIVYINYTMMTVGYFRPFYVNDIFGKKILMSYGGTISQHFGDSLETTANVKFEVRDLLPVNDYLNMSFKFYEGFSYNSGDKEYEDGTDKNPDKKYSFQHNMIFDLGFNLEANSNIELLFRLHHRSGVYGLIAPRKVGSNFLGIGLNYKF
jgi:hypothetical protein